MNQVETVPEVKVDINTAQEKVDSNLQQQKTVDLQPIQESEKEINWKKWKESRAQERKQAEEISKRAAEKEAEANALKAALEAALNKPSYGNNQTQDNTYNTEETEEQRIQRLVDAQIAKREQEYEKQRREREQLELPEKLKSVHRDFDQVCCPTNYDYLEYHHPELAKSLGRQQDSFEKWNDIYNAIKRYVPNIDSQREQLKASANFNKPQSLSSAGVTQGGNAMPSARLDEQRKSANWARMQKTLKGLSS